jgi:hypothetical protein
MGPWLPHVGEGVHVGIAESGPMFWMAGVAMSHGFDTHIGGWSSIHFWLLVWNMAFMFHFIYGMSFQPH